MKFITSFILGITLALTAVSADKKIPETAAKGWCFIAPDGGKKWHAKRSCRSLKNSTNVKYLLIEDAKKLGKNEKNGSMAVTFAGVNTKRKSSIFCET